LRQLGERDQLCVLALLDRWIDGPAVRAALRVAEPGGDPVDHLVREGVAELVRVHVRFGGRVPHEVRQQPLDDPVLADDPFCAGPSLPRQERLLVLAALDQTVLLETLQHLARRGTRDAEHLRDAR
jgi:hypothetical protein